MGKKSILTTLQIALFLAYTFFMLGMVFSRGVCCADDARHAELANNFAHGYGYATTTQEAKFKYSITLFDTHLGTGPVIELPLALIIKLFGNTYWAPGVAAVFIWALLLFAIGIQLKKRYFHSQTGFLIAEAFFFLLSFLFSALHIEQWFALLGEVPAGLLVILAINTYLEGSSKLKKFIAGVFFALAVYIKIIAVIALASSILFLGVYYFYKHQQGVRKWGEMLYMFLGFFLIVALFEIWTLLSLHFSHASIADHYLDLKAYILDKGSAYTTEYSWDTPIQTRINTLQDRFGLFLPCLPIIFLAIGMLVREDNKAFLLFSAYCAVATGMTFYWLFLSIGWARYFFISLMLILFVLVLPFLSKMKYKNWLFPYAATLVLMTWPQWHHAGYPLFLAEGKLFQPTSDTRSLIETTKFLSEHTHMRPFVTQWWATATDMEYMLPTHLNFTTYKDSRIKSRKVFILAVNTRFLVEDEEFSRFMEQCSTIRRSGPYLIALCFSP